MGFFARLFGRERAEAPALLQECRRSSEAPKAALPGPGTFSVRVVGELQYQAHLSQICGPRNDYGENLDVEAQLVHENTNPYGPMAIRVDVQGLTVGYLNRDNAREYRKQLASAGHPGLDAWCRARIRGGWDRGPNDQGMYGVLLDLPVSD